MRGRRTPPPIIYMPPRDDDPSQDADYTYFAQHPDATQYTRAVLPGEAPEPLPPGSWVVVRRIGRAGRARAFCTPQEGMN